MLVVLVGLAGPGGGLGTSAQSARWPRLQSSPRQVTVDDDMGMRFVPCIAPMPVPPVWSNGPTGAGPSMSNAQFGSRSSGRGLL